MVALKVDVVRFWIDLLCEVSVLMASIFVVRLSSYTYTISCHLINHSHHYDHASRLEPIALRPYGCGAYQLTFQKS